MLLIIEFPGTIPSPHRKEKEDKRRKKFISGKKWTADGEMLSSTSRWQFTSNPFSRFFNFQHTWQTSYNCWVIDTIFFSGNSIIKWSYHPKEFRGRQFQIRVSDRWVVVIKAKFSFLGLYKPFKTIFNWIAFLTFIIVLLNLKRDNTSHIYLSRRHFVYF